MPTLLILLLALPAAGAVAVAVLGALGRRPGGGNDNDGAVRWVSLAVTTACLGLAAVLAAGYASLPRVQERIANRAVPKAEFVPEIVPGAGEDAPHVTRWVVFRLGDQDDGSATAMQFYLGLDGLNVWLVVLTALLMVPAVLISWKAVEERVPEFFAWMLALETAMLGVFLAFDIILFYVFFELTLVPLFFLIGIWGGPQRQYAARKFFIYTLAGSLFTLLGVLGIIITLAQGTGDKPAPMTFSIPELVRGVDRHGKELEQKVADARRAPAAEGDGPTLLDRAEADLAGWRRVQLWVFAAMMCGFAIKVPLVPVHTWLPLAHTEAPTAGSVILAGVLLKIGTYGFLRLCVPLAPDAALTFGAPLVGVLAVVGIIYGSFCALAQHDIKKLVAYSSVSHMGFCMLGLFALNEVGLTGGVLTMLNHGLSTGALFLLVGMLYERYHTRRVHDYGGMGARLKLLAAFFVFMTMTSIGLPGLNGFVGEALVLMGMYNFRGAQVDGRLLATVAVFGVLLGAWYMLTLVMRVFFGPVREPAHEGHGPVRDLDAREVVCLVPIALACLVIGVYSKPVVDLVRPDVRVVAGIAAQARDRAEKGTGTFSAAEKVPVPFSARAPGSRGE